MVGESDDLIRRFQPLARLIARLGVQFAPQSRKSIMIDTAQITQIYLQRPKLATTMSLGLWFTVAHNLDDRELQLCASSLETKLLIVAKGYNRLPLEPLVEWNNWGNGIGKGKGVSV